jgi:hypothetical protein
MREIIETDRDIDALRNRPDFTLVRMDLNFPNNVFSR